MINESLHFSKHYTKNIKLSHHTSMELSKTKSEFDEVNNEETRKCEI
jgi:hypothetical protein